MTLCPTIRNVVRQWMSSDSASVCLSRRAPSTSRAAKTAWYIHGPSPLYYVLLVPTTTVVRNIYRPIIYGGR